MPISAVNSQITDAVTQSNVEVVGVAPAMALALLCQVNSHAIGLALHNAVSQHQLMSTIGHATVAIAVRQILAAGRQA